MLFIAPIDPIDQPGARSYSSAIFHFITQTAALFESVNSLFCSYYDDARGKGYYLGTLNVYFMVTLTGAGDATTH